MAKKFNTKLWAILGSIGGIIITFAFIIENYEGAKLVPRLLFLPLGAIAGALLLIVTMYLHFLMYRKDIFDDGDQKA